MLRTYTKYTIAVARNSRSRICVAIDMGAWVDLKDWRIACVNHSRRLLNLGGRTLLHAVVKGSLFFGTVQIRITRSP